MNDISVIEWKRAAEELPDADITVFVAFADGEILLGFYSGAWVAFDAVPFLEADQPVAWAHVPEVPECLLTICENPRNLRKETEAR